MKDELKYLPIISYFILEKRYIRTSHYYSILLLSFIHLPFCPSQGGKVVMKDELKYLPIIGWSLYLAEQVFVKRNFAEDRQSLRRQLGHLAAYQYPMSVSIIQSQEEERGKRASWLYVNFCAWSFSQTSSASFSCVARFLVWGGGGGQDPQMYRQKQWCDLSARASASQTYIFMCQNTCYIYITKFYQHSSHILALHNNNIPTKHLHWENLCTVCAKWGWAPPPPPPAGVFSLRR